MNFKKMELITKHDIFRHVQCSCIFESVGEGATHPKNNWQAKWKKTRINKKRGGQLNHDFHSNITPPPKKKGGESMIIQNVILWKNVCCPTWCYIWGNAIWKKNTHFKIFFRSALNLGQNQCVVFQSALYQRACIMSCCRILTTEIY